MQGTIALIVAGGRGSRLAGEIPKQYRLLGGTAILRHSVEAFLHHPKVDKVAVVIHPDDVDLYNEAMEGLSLLPPIHGGKERQDSVRLGLESLETYQPRYVLIHDAARPYVSAALILRVIEALGVHSAVLPVIPVTDTVKRIHGELVCETLDRSSLALAQTPQGFHYTEILAAHKKCKEERYTDDAALFEQLQIKVHKVEGEAGNIKITTEKDMQQHQETRVGMGFDAHRFAGEGTSIMLCGVAVPHDKTIEAHSDGDVGIHALVDALLGAIGAGDIGMHFPPSDMRWKGADSSDFLRYTHELVQRAGGSIINIDITIIGESPKVTPHREKMVMRLAELLGISMKRVSVKATTTEKMGFTGRKEGIAAQAVVSVRMSEAIQIKFPPSTIIL